MEWILSHFGGVGAFIVFVMIVRGVLKVLRQAAEAQKNQSKRRPAEQDPEAAERTRRVQEEIRKKIAERRALATGNAPSRPAAEASAPSPLSRMPPLVRPVGVPPIDTFGGPMQRMPKRVEPPEESQRDWQREIESEPANEPATAAILERQRQLQEQMRELETRRRTEQKRATEITAMRDAERMTSAKMAPVGRGELLTELRDAHSLRRAIVLREVLGAPVGMR